MKTTIESNYARLQAMKDRQSADIFAAGGSEDLTLIGEADPMAQHVAQVSREEPEQGQLF